jgi:hypothetical protein
MEFAPIQRVWNVPYESQANNKSASPIRLLEANLEVFPAESAQVLEYWLDSSKSSGYSRPAKKVFFTKEVFAADLASYARRGIRHVTTFACWIDEEYLKTHGEPPLNEYGKALQNYRA